MEWEAGEEVALLKEWHGNPNDGEPEKLRCAKCGGLVWNRRAIPPGGMGSAGSSE